MTRTLQQITDYIENHINSMNKTIEYAKRFDDRKERTDYAFHSIDKEDEQAFGALTFLNVYLQEIDDDDYKKLSKKLADGYHKATHRVYDELFY